MKLVLKHKDTPLLCFTAKEGAQPDIRIDWINETKQFLFPLDLHDINEENLLKWIKQRSVPRNRAYVDTLLSASGLSINRPLDIIRFSKGLSLNDSYWIVDSDFDGLFDQFDLYYHSFSRVLGRIAFTGYGTIADYARSSPEYTTNGMLPKCWRRVNGTVYLYKGGTSGFSNSGNEPYAEYYTCQIAKALEIDHVSYQLSKWKGILCCVCPLFTNKDLSFVPVEKIITKGGYEAVYRYYQSLGDRFIRSFHEMIVFDALIFNTNRHFGNFGFLLDSDSNVIVSPAPLFDHGNALLSLIGLDRLNNQKDVLAYANTLLPCVYDDFVSEAKKYIDSDMRKKIRSLLAFRFKKHPRYNWSDTRLKMLETVIHERAKQLLEQ